MIDDNTFGRIARGELNPGKELLSPELANFATDTSDMRHNLWLLYGIARGLGPPASNTTGVRVLEIGTNDGTSTLAFLKAASEGGGHVVSIDKVDVPAAQGLVDHFGLRAHWTFIKGDSRDLLPILVAEGRQFDLVLVDGDHTQAGAERDIRASGKLLTHGGLLLTHDSWMIAVDYDGSKPFGERALPGCGLATRDLLDKNEEWTGLSLPFGYVLSLFRRRAACLAEIDLHVQGAREHGSLP